MEFQVSARKWRPQKFGELIGQEHIVQTMTNAIGLDRVSHAYLFSGTRGVGKTTTARIFAKALNCTESDGVEPCDRCVPCQEIKQGRCVDVQEIDGASNNGVAEVRDLIENVQYATASCRYKIYIIDEVHMLSKSAFNALLKTLEEPPPQVVFIFATTELNKIPETILSRCQCFEFKPLTHKQIIRQLEIICEREKIEIDRQSLESIAKNGAGSMRDAQSLLDQVIAFCGKQVGTGSVEEVLGIVGQKTLRAVVDHLVARDAAALVDSIQSIVDAGKDLNYFCRDLVEYLRHLMMVKVASRPESLLDGNTCDLEILQLQARGFDMDELQQMFTVLSRVEMEMRRNSLARMIFEMAVLRLTDVRPFRKIDDMIRKINTMEKEMETGESSAGNSPGRETRGGEGWNTDSNISDPSREDGTERGHAAQAVSPSPADANLTASQVEALSGKTETSDHSSWDRIAREICQKKRMFGHYLTSCRLRAFDESVLHLEIFDNITKDLLGQEENIQIIREAVKTVCGASVQVELSLAEKNDAPNGSGKGNPVPGKKKMNRPGKTGFASESEIIQEALDIFGGVVVG